jgi:hypothetical protein
MLKIANMDMMRKLETTSDRCRANVVGIRTSRNYAEKWNSKVKENVSLCMII